jgi:hypothetical protein
MALLTRGSASPTADSWPVQKSWGGVIGLVGAAGLLAVGAVALLWTVRQPLSPLSLFVAATGTLACAAAAGLAVIALGYFRLSYRFAPGVLLIRWHGPTETILLKEIDGIYAGQRVGSLRHVRGLSWPGYHVGSVRTRTLGTLRVFCTDRRMESLSVIVTAARTLVLSPRDPPAFRRELVRRIETDQEPGPSPAGVRSGGLPPPLVIAVLGGALALLLAQLVGLLASYQTMPEMITLPNYSAGGSPSLSPRSDVFELPLLGAGVLGLNVALALALRGRETATTLLLCGSAVLVEAIILLATLRLLPGG